jgi:hypothetical protein
MSLQGDSRKIPLNIPNRLTMSKVGDFAIKTEVFRGKGYGYTSSGKKEYYRPQ